MKILKLLLLLLAFGLETSAAMAQPPDLRDLAESLLAAESHFADSVAKLGTRDGFLLFLADDAILFRPEPVAGLKWLREHPAAPGLLKWKPNYVDLAGSGDLGFTTGPWEYWSSKDADSAEAYGNYVTVWRSDSSATWRVVCDIGVGCPPSVSAPQAVALSSFLGGHTKLSKVKADSAAMYMELVNVNSAFERSVDSGGLPGAYREFASENVRCLRDGKKPVENKHQLKSVLDSNVSKATWSPARIEVSLAGDLGYSCGTVEYLQRNITAAFRNAAYLRIWRKQEDGHWEIELDIEHVIPPAATE